MSRLIDLTGQRFGLLTVLHRSGQPHSCVYWVCRCDCGSVIEVSGNNLKRGHTVSCGCRRVLPYLGKRFGRLTVLYPTAKRTVAALGYRFGHKFTLLRKRNMVRLKKSLSECYRAMRHHRKIRPKLAQGLLSRLGQMKHCNHVHFFENYVEQGLQRKLKLVVREQARKEQARWNMCTEPLPLTA